MQTTGGNLMANTQHIHDTEREAERHLGDYLDLDKIQHLYGSHQNHYGSSLLSNEITRLLTDSSRMHQTENALSSRYGGPETEQFLRGTNDIMRERAEKLVKACIDRHVRTKAPQLEGALVQMGLNPEQICALPRNANGHIDDSFAAGPRSGASMLYEDLYKPQIEHLFSSDRRASLGQGRA